MLREGTTTVRALPGAKELLAALSAREDMSQGAVTGNFEVTARVKLEGSRACIPICAAAPMQAIHEHRPDLPRIAKERWEQRTGRSLRAEQCVIVGDTPRDLDAALTKSYEVCPRGDRKGSLGRASVLRRPEDVFARSHRYAGSVKPASESVV